LEFLKEIFNQLYDVRGLVAWAGYAGLAVIVFAETGIPVCFFLPGDALLVTAGLFAATGDLNLLYINLLLVPAAVLGNITGYWTGYKSGPRLFKKEESLLFRKSYLTTTKEFYETRGALALVIARFIPLLRTFVPIVAGIGRMDYKRFLFFNITGALVWVTGLTLLGYYLGTYIPGAERHIEKMIIGIIVLSNMPLVIKFFQKKMRKRS
jgi:membrane-associated protein